MILTMENAGQFIEDEELRAQIKGSGIGTSATRAGILTKLVNIKYLNLNKKTQIITPTQLGEMIYETVACSMKPMLNPALTASWEKGLTGVAEGSISEKEYMDKLDDFVSKRTNLVKQNDYRRLLLSRFDYVSTNYKKAETKKSSAKKTTKKKAAKEATAKETTVEGSNEASTGNE
jgi:DNA topoisomerase-3